MVCKEDCSHSVPHDRRDGCGKCLDFCAGCIPVEPPEEPKTEYEIKCRYCGDIQIVNEMSFEKIIENGCEKECRGCGKQGYEPIIPEGLFILSYENLIEAIQDHPCLDLVDGEPEEENCLCYTKSCPKWLDDICRNSTGCANCSTRTTEPPTGNLEIENAEEIENGPKIVHGGVTFEIPDEKPEKDDDCPHDQHGNEMFNGRPRTKCFDCDKWLEPDFDSDAKNWMNLGNDDCLCDKEPVAWLVEVGHGELIWVCPDCKKIYGNWKPIHLRKKKECWLCEGTGSVMMDRQTGAMFPKEPSINWSEKDCYEHQCPNCGVDTESTIRIPEIVASEIGRHVTEDILYESTEDFVLSALRAEISLARRRPSPQEDQKGECR